ncbi:MAG: GntR family transcriptional regulator, partial [Anaerolineales bacterium]|nr:GntR family transcriptional regulator [Anaerolineales bacterium]
MDWDAPLKPNELCEQRLIAAILDGHFPIDSALPGERDLAEQLGVTRPTLRETLQRLARDGWLDIQQGKPTRVRNYWEEGNLAVLDAIARFPQQQPADFVPNLLYIRQLMAPAYARLAVERNAECIQALLKEYIDLPEDVETFA